MTYFRSKMVSNDNIPWTAKVLIHSGSSGWEENCIVSFPPHPQWWGDSVEPFHFAVFDHEIWNLAHLVKTWLGDFSYCSRIFPHPSTLLCTRAVRDAKSECFLAHFQQLWQSKKLAGASFWHHERPHWHESAWYFAHRQKRAQWWSYQNQISRAYSSSDSVAPLVEAKLILPIGFRRLRSHGVGSVGYLPWFRSITTCVRIMGPFSSFEIVLRG